jgi:hypothetical protein
MHGSPCKFRLSFCVSSEKSPFEKSPLAITLMAGASAGLAGWDKCRVLFVVMVERSRPASSPCRKKAHPAESPFEKRYSVISVG